MEKECEKCIRTMKLHGTLCKEHKVSDQDINQANDMVDVNGDLIEINDEE